MSGDFGLGAMTGILPTVLTAGVAVNMVDRLGLGAQQPPAAVAKTDTCRKCGSSIDADWNFCMACGSSVKGGAKGTRTLDPRHSKPARPTTASPTADFKKAVFGGQAYDPFK